MPQERIVLTLLALALAACGGSSTAPEGSSSAPGSIVQNPNAGGVFNRFVVDAHRGGQAGQVSIVDVRWGRLVELHDLDPVTGQRTPLFTDLAVDPFVISDGVDYLLERSPVSGREELTILHPFDSPGWRLAFQRLEGGLVPLLERGLGANVLPPYSALPRNAALVIVLNDLLDASTVSGQNVQLEIGYPPVVRFEARVVADRNHGDLLAGTFHSTRVVVDATVDEIESQLAGLPVNGVGLPGAVTTAKPNVALRLPTRPNPAAAQFSVLRNLGGNPLAFGGNGPVDPLSPTLDLVRALRSGGTTQATGDPFNGFLRDQDRPRLIGVQGVSVTAVAPLGGDSFSVDLLFANASCAMAVREGDLLVLASGMSEVVSPSALLPGGTLSGVLVKRLAGGAPSSGAGELRSAFDSSAGHVPECFVTFSPAPGPGGFVSPAASAELRFSEPMNPEAADPFETLRLVDPSVPATDPLHRRVVATLAPSPGLDRFSLDPVFPLRHVQGQSETFHLELHGGATGVTDLAGNPLVETFGTAALTLDAAAPTVDTGGVSLSFTSPDEDGDGNPELRGQVVLDLSAGELQARAVTRFSREVSSSTSAAPTAMMMIPFGGRPDPLSPYGSRVQAVWRYHDLGMSLLDEAAHNVDVEGLAWMPAAGGVNVNTFPRFEIALAHSKYLPDESFVSTGVFFPSSGMTTDYAGNLLDPVADPLTVVHPRTSGYLVQPLEAFVAPGGQVMAPYPLNRNMPPSQFRYWTWRDTAVQAVGGPNGQGVDTKRLIDLTGIGTASIYPAGQVPTIGLPLLMELRAWPDSQILGESRAMMAIATGVGVPFFRAWSTGFVTPGGVTQPVNPDQIQTAIGGVDDAGNLIPGTDIGVYYGTADFVTRVSRAHTIWLDTGAMSSFAGPVTLTDLPGGTSVELAFRGAAQVIDPTGAARDARSYDPYGDPNGPGGGFGVVYLNQDPTWKSSLAELDGARWIQVRITMGADAQSGVLPRLSAIGLPYVR